MKSFALKIIANKYRLLEGAYSLDPAGDIWVYDALDMEQSRDKLRLVLFDPKFEYSDVTRFGQHIEAQKIQIIDEGTFQGVEYFAFEATTDEIIQKLYQNWEKRIDPKPIYSSSIETRVEKPKDTVQEKIQRREFDGMPPKQPVKKSGLRTVVGVGSLVAIFLLTLGFLTPMLIDRFTPTNTSTLDSTATVLPPNTPIMTNSPRASCIGWEFNKDGDSEGWQVNLSVVNLRAEGGVLRGEFDQFDPSILSPQQLNIDTSKYKILSIRYRINSDDTDGEVMWNPNNDLGFTETMRILYGIVTDNEWHTVDVRLDATDWTSTPIVNVLRLDPVYNAKRGAFEYDYIRICE